MPETRAAEGLGLGATTQDPFGPFTSFGKEQGKAVQAALSVQGVPAAALAGSCLGEVHEEAKLVVDIQGGVSGFAEAHLVPLSFLVVLAAG